MACSVLKPDCLRDVFKFSVEGLIILSNISFPKLGILRTDGF